LDRNRVLRVGVLLAFRLYRAAGARRAAEAEAAALYGDDSRSVANYMSGFKLGMRDAWKFNALLAVWFLFSLATWLLGA
jgi:hypothetical protein